MKSITRLTTRHNSAMAKMNFLIKNKIPFRYSLSSRTIVIEYSGVREKFMQNKMNAKAFIAYAMIKRDLISKKIKIPNISSWHVRYYQHDIKKTERIKQGYYIDIKSAYANILFNDGYITEKTFVYIMSLPKTDRLACIGMLASKKQWYSVAANGEVVEEYEEVNELSGIFFYAVKKTFEIMDVCKMLLGADNAILNWVDCVYFRTYDDRAKDVIYYLDSVNLDCHFNSIDNFSTVVFKNKIRIRFKDGAKLKIFYLPIARSYSAVVKINMSSKIIKSDKAAIINHYKNKPR